MEQSASEFQKWGKRAPGKVGGSSYTAGAFDVFPDQSCFRCLDVQAATGSNRICCHGDFAQHSTRHNRSRTNPVDRPHSCGSVCNTPGGVAIGVDTCRVMSGSKVAYQTGNVLNYRCVTLLQTVARSPTHYPFAHRLFAVFVCSHCHNFW